MSTSAEGRVSPRTETEVPAALARLAADGLIERGAGGAEGPRRVTGQEAVWKTSRGFQRAMARAAAALYENGDPGDDLRVPIALALLDTYQSSIDDELLAELVETMLPIEATSLGFVRDHKNKEK